MKGNALRPDAQAFDEVTIRTVPRYKQSNMSGDEWRISAEITFHRNGGAYHSATFSNVEIALQFAMAEHHRATDNGLGYFASIENVCDQEGCNAAPIVWYKKLSDYCNEGHKTPACKGFDIRQFCSKHATRGDCALDDADRNYKTVEDIR